MSTSTPTDATTTTSTNRQQHTNNPLKKVLSYLQGQAGNAAKDRWEGSAYLSPRGPEPQQRYRKGSRKGVEKGRKESGEGESETRTGE